MIILFVLLAIVILLVVGVIIFYNGLVRQRNLVEQADSDIVIQLKRRYDLIPNLIRSVKGYMSHERETLESVTNARTMAINQPGRSHSSSAQKAENILEGALKSLFAVAENYPDLKASSNFLQLQDELVDAEDKIMAARRFFNGTLKEYSDKLQVFPSNLIAGMFSFSSQDYQYFEVDNPEVVAQAPEVAF